ncbi:hypothetical protein DXG01_014439 [Tephrocybe rancida]|nr:hypothetical protein DXG01_014439 [Tephrocybe rancida]
MADLVYLTDQIIIMGYPAEGIEGWYRNRREDAKRFLEHRHGKNFWVFNFCPIRENSYDESLFGGRVSRYPFPDHHAPPLIFMPLVAREMRAWLRGSSERVAVLHCKAGKGRSGTMACTYLLSLDDNPSAPKLKRNYSAKEWAHVLADDVMAVIPEDDDNNTGSAEASGATTPNFQVEEASSSTSSKATKHHPDTLNTVLDLHTSRRMKRSSSPSKKPKQGVSIPSQRRWLYYWALLLSHTAPTHMWAVPPVPSPKVRLTRINLRMRHTSTAGLVRAASVLLERTKGAKNTMENGEAHVWASLARYDDELIDALDEWERRTRDEGGRMGVRRLGSEFVGEEELRDVFAGDRWDKEKMVKTFARMGTVGADAVGREIGESKVMWHIHGIRIALIMSFQQDDKIDVYKLSPLTNQKWGNLRNKLEKEDKLNPEDVEGPASETSSLYDVTQNAKEQGVVLDAGREVRIKLYTGQVFMGWLWLVPTFHMAPVSDGPTKLRLTRKELDFPLGLGSAIIDVEIEMEWLVKADAELVQPPAPQKQSDDIAGTAAAVLTSVVETIPIRQLRRTTRIARAIVKDNENANARPSRALTRSKATATDAPTARQTTIVSLAGKVKAGDDKAVGKRKREALVEVTGVSNNNRKTKEGGKGKEKEKEVEVVAEEPAKPRAFGRQVMRPISGAAAQRSSRSTSISTTTSNATTDSSSVVQATRPTVFTRRPALKPIGEAETDRAAKRRHTEETARRVEDESQIEADKIADELVDLDQEVADGPTKEEIQGWDDLDAGDWDDPAMVSEYVAEVCVYLKEIELQTRPNPDYMASHPELDWEKRGILVDWILQVHARFNLLQETLFLFTNILDRFLSSRPISLSKLQLVGITAFFIAAKYEETYAPSVAEIAYLADGQYTVEEILKAERYILKTINWDLRYPGPMGWLRRGSKADDCDTQARTVGKYLIEIGCLEWRLVGTLPSLLAAAAMWLARLVLGREVWTPNLEHYMTYSEAELLPTANILINYILEPIQHESLFKKYAHKRYLKCSAFMRHWALERWSESAVVDLAHELPALKEDIAHERRALAAAAAAAAEEA